MILERGTTRFKAGKLVKGELFAKIDETESVAKESSSEKQSFSRIKDIKDLGGVIQIELYKTPIDDRDSVTMTYAEACKRLFSMKKMAPMVNLQDAKSFVEILELLEARLNEVALTHKSVVTENGFVSLV